MGDENRLKEQQLAKASALAGRAAERDLALRRAGALQFLPALGRTADPVGLKFAGLSQSLHCEHPRFAAGGPRRPCY